MRERVEGLVGRRTRAMWVMTFHAACARMLRVEAPRLGYTKSFTIYDQADSRRVVKHCIDELGVDPKRFTPAAIHNQISDAKNKLRDAESYGQMVGSYFEQTVADVFRLYESELHRVNAMDFDDLLVRAVNVLELFPEVRRRYADHLPLRDGRRVPGHEPRPVPLAAAALQPRRRRRGWRPRQPHGRRRRRPVGLQLPRRRHPQHPRLRGRLPRRQGRQARAELPLDADHPLGRQRRRRQQPRAQEQVAVDRPRRRGQDRRARARRRARRGALRRRARSSSSSTRGPRARRSRSSTGPTRSPACWKSGCGAPTSPTRWSAA